MYGTPIQIENETDIMKPIGIETIVFKQHEIETSASRSTLKSEQMPQSWLEFEHAS